MEPWRRGGRLHGAMLLMMFTTTGRCQPTSRLSPTEVPDRCSATPPPQLAAGGIVAALTHTQLLFGGATNGPGAGGWVNDSLGCASPGAAAFRDGTVQVVVGGDAHADLGSPKWFTGSHVVKRSSDGGKTWAASVDGPAQRALKGAASADPTASSLGVTGVHQLASGEAIAFTSACCCVSGCAGDSLSMACADASRPSPTADNATSTWRLELLRSTDSGLSARSTNVSLELPQFLTLKNTKHAAIVATADGSLIANVYGSAPGDGQRHLKGPGWVGRLKGKTLPKFRVFVITAEPSALAWRYRSTVAFDLVDEDEFTNPAWNKTHPPPANFSKNHRPMQGTAAKHEGFDESYIVSMAGNADRIVCVLRTGCKSSASAAAHACTRLRPT